MAFDRMQRADANWSSYLKHSRCRVLAFRRAQWRWYGSGPVEVDATGKIVIVGAAPPESKVDDEYAAWKAQRHARKAQGR